MLPYSGMVKQQAGRQAVGLHNMLCNFWEFTSTQRPKFKESRPFENVF